MPLAQFFLELKHQHFNQMIYHPLDLALQLQRPVF